MEENMDKRTGSNDILNDAIEDSALRKSVADASDVSSETSDAASENGGDTVVFSKSEVKRQIDDDDLLIVSRSKMNDTAEIRGGAVVRPLKQNQPPPRPGPRSDVVPLRYDWPTANRSGDTAKAGVKGSAPHTPSVPAAPVQSVKAPAPAANPQTVRSTAPTVNPVSGRVPAPAVKPSVGKASEPAANPAVSRAPAPTVNPANGRVPAPAVKPAVGGKTPASVTNPVSGRVPAPAVKPSVGKTPASAVKNTDGKPADKKAADYKPSSDEVDYMIDKEATAQNKIIGKRDKKKKEKKQDSMIIDTVSSSVMSIVKAVVYIVVIIAVSIALAVFAINTANDVFKFVVDEKMIEVEIPEDATVDEVADILKENGLIKYKWAYKIWTNMKDENAVYVPGRYTLSTTLNYDYLRGAMKKTVSREEVRITIPEGYTVDEIIDLFVSKGIGTKEGFAQAINSYDFNYNFIKGVWITSDSEVYSVDEYAELSEDAKAGAEFLEGIGDDSDKIYRLEGFLFPDTYNFYKDSTEVAVINKLLDNFNRKFTSEYYLRCKDISMSVDEAITLASMVEKETRYADELGYVSSVFHNRLNTGGIYRKLQSDATAVYAIAHDLGQRPENVTGEHMEYETPYNTYLYDGLPPGAIANPGLNAIKYALYPNTSDYYYFVADASGHSLFAKTEDEHNENINTVRGNN